MSTIKENIAAGAVRSFYDAGDFLRLQSGSGLNLSFFRSGVEIHRSEDVSQGYAAKVPQGFDRIDIGNPTAGAVDVHCFIAADGIEIDYTGQTGAVAVSSIAGQQGPHTQAAKTVTNASGLFLAANASRRFLLVQNQDAAANMWLATDGGAASADGNCIKIGPGDTLFLDAYPPTGALYAISDAASMAAHVSEG